MERKEKRTTEHTWTVKKNSKYREHKLQIPLSPWLQTWINMWNIKTTFSLIPVSLHTIYTHCNLLFSVSPWKFIPSLKLLLHSHDYHSPWLYCCDWGYTSHLFLITSHGEDKIETFLWAHTSYRTKKRWSRFEEKSRVSHLRYMKKGGKFLTKLWCCVGRRV